MNIYQEVILDHYKHPRNKGLEDEFDYKGYAVNPLCGDEAVAHLRVVDGALSMTHLVRGCAISQAAASILSEIVEGRHPDEISELLVLFASVVSGVAGASDVHEQLEAFAGVSKYPARIKCALLPVKALQEALWPT